MSHAHGGEVDLEALGGTLSIEESDRPDVEWVLRDTETNDELILWPSEVPEMIALLKAFKATVENDPSVHDRVQHDCREWSVAHELDEVEDAVYNCAVCDNVYTLEGYSG